MEGPRAAPRESWGKSTGLWSVASESQQMCQSQRQSAPSSSAILHWVFPCFIQSFFCLHVYCLSFWLCFPLAIQRSCHTWVSSQSLNLALLWARDWLSWTPTVPSKNTENILWFSIFPTFRPRVLKDRVSDWTNHHLDNLNFFCSASQREKEAF